MITFIIVIIFIYIQMYTEIPDLASEKVLATLVELHRKNWKHFLRRRWARGEGDWICRLC